MIKKTFEQERLDDFLSILPENLDDKTSKVIEEYMGILMEAISLFEKHEGISEEYLHEITKNLVNSFKLVVSILIKEKEGKN